MGSERGTIHIDQALTNISVGYHNDSFIAGQVLPIVPVAKQSDKYFIFGKENFRLNDDARADKSPSKRVLSYTVSSDSFYCDKHSVHDVVSEDERANADAPINPDITVTKRLTEMIDLRKEYDTASYLFNTTTFAGYTAALAGGDRWDDYTSSDPLVKIDTIKSSIKKASGIEPNTLVLGKEVYDKVKRHPDLLDIFKYTSKGILTVDMLAEAFEVERVIIGTAVYNSAKEKATETNSFLWGKYALLAYISKSPALDTPSLGYNFAWKIFGGATALVKKWRDEDLDGDKIEVTKAYDNKITAITAGYLLSTVVS